MAVNSLFVLMCRYTHCVKVYPRGRLGKSQTAPICIRRPIGWGVSVRILLWRLVRKN